MTDEGGVLDGVGADLLAARERRAGVEQDAGRCAVEQGCGDLERLQLRHVLAEPVGEDDVGRADGGFQIVGPHRTGDREVRGAALRQIKTQHPSGFLPRPGDVTVGADEEEPLPVEPTPLADREEVGQHLAGVIDVGHRIHDGERRGVGQPFEDADVAVPHDHDVGP